MNSSIKPKIAPNAIMVTLVVTGSIKMRICDLCGFIGHDNYLGMMIDIGGNDILCNCWEFFPPF